MRFHRRFCWRWVHHHQRHSSVLTHWRNFHRCLINSFLSDTHIIASCICSPRLISHLSHSLSPVALQSIPHLQAHRLAETSCTYLRLLPFQTNSTPHPTICNRLCLPHSCFCLYKKLSVFLWVTVSWIIYFSLFLFVRGTWWGTAIVKVRRSDPFCTLFGNSPIGSLSTPWCLLFPISSVFPIDFLRQSRTDQFSSRGGGQRRVLGTDHRRDRITNKFVCFLFPAKDWER